MRPIEKTAQNQNQSSLEQFQIRSLTRRIDSDMELDVVGLLETDLHVSLFPRNLHISLD